MQTRDIIVVGASVGGVTALKDLIRALPVDFRGAVFIVLHIPAYSQTSLPAILSKAGLLEAVLAKDGDRIELGKIYVAPSDHHLLLEHDKMVVKKGPKENRFRPSIDSLFRSAAYIYGPRVIAIILSGLLDDGASGIWTVNRLGGITIVQDPKDAEQSQLPINVKVYTEVDYTMSASDIGPLLAGLIKEGAPERFKFSPEELKLLETEVAIATHDNAFQLGILDLGVLTPFTCPECNGILVRLFEGTLIRYRCHTGHAYTASSLLAEVSETVETNLWQSMRALEEITMLLNVIARHYDDVNDSKTGDLFRAKAENTGTQAQVLHDTIFKQQQYSEDLRFESTKA